MSQQKAEELDQWLAKWDLQNLTNHLKLKGLKSSRDFKYIKTQIHFDKLVTALGDNISFMDTCKLEDAWRSIVPKRNAADAQVLFLGREEKNILHELNKKFNYLSNDLEYIKQSFTDFNRSVEKSTQDVNAEADKIISIINQKRNELLKNIDSIRRKNEHIYNGTLARLNKLHGMLQSNKHKFNEIAANDNIAASYRLQLLKELLTPKETHFKSVSLSISTTKLIKTINRTHGHAARVTKGECMALENVNTAGQIESDEDDSKADPGSDDSADQEGQDHDPWVDMFRAECILPGNLSFTFAFDEDAFTNQLQNNFSIHSDDDKTFKWNSTKATSTVLQTEKDFVQFTFDVCGKNYFNITDNGTVVAGNGTCSYGVVTTNTCFSEGIHEWKIKSVRRRCCRHDMGVITDITHLADVGEDDGVAEELTPTGYCYLWWHGSYLKAFYQGEETDSVVLDAPMTEGDIITIRLDCTGWTITFIQNDKVVGSMKVKENESYHPFVNTDGCAIQQYQLITNKTMPVNATFEFDVFEKKYFTVQKYSYGKNYVSNVTGKTGCSYSIVSTRTSFNKGIHRWQIKIVTRGHVYMDFGVVTNVKRLNTVGRAHANAAELKCCGYCYLWYYGTTLEGFNDGGSLGKKSCEIGIQDGDIITLVLNCVEWKLIFRKNDQEVGFLNLTPNQSYHPMVHCCGCSLQQFQLL
eukprot:112116_1